MKISVVIPTHNRPEGMVRAVTSVLQQKVDCEFDVFVASNGSPSEESIFQFYKNFGPKSEEDVRLLHDPVAGVARARNAGLNHTDGELVAFLDDDATAMPGWLQQFKDDFERMQFKLVKVSGEINPQFAHPVPSWLTPNMMIIIGAWSGMKPAAEYKSMATFEFNCCYKRAALVEVGGFNEDFGFKPGSLVGCENIVDDLLLMKGYGIYYDPNVRCNHIIPAVKMTKEYIRRRWFWQGVTNFERIKYLTAAGATFKEDELQHDMELPSHTDMINIEDGIIDDRLMHKMKCLGQYCRAVGVV